MTIIAALGDSLTCGEGVSVQVPLEQTWVALLASATPDGRLVRLAEPGARVRDVRVHQLPRVGAADIVTVLVGLNDIARAGFDAQVLRADLMATVDALTGAGARVVLGRLHDPTRMLPVPRLLADVVRRRIREVNNAVDAAAASDGVQVLDLAAVPALDSAGGWSADRIHPSRAGHQGMAAAAAAALSRWYEQLPAAVGPPNGAPRGPSRTARTWWAMRHGLPYLAGHLTSAFVLLKEAGRRRANHRDNCRARFAAGQRSG